MLSVEILQFLSGTFGSNFFLVWGSGALKTPPIGGRVPGKEGSPGRLGGGDRPIPPEGGGGGGRPRPPEGGGDGSPKPPDGGGGGGGRTDPPNPPDGGGGGGGRIDPPNPPDGGGGRLSPAEESGGGKPNDERVF